MKFIFFFLIFTYIDAKEILECSTQSHIGLNFLGKDYDKILNHLELRNFKIRLSRTREEIYKQEKEKNNLKNNYSSKTSHFIEIILIKSSGHPIPLHCSWVFDVRVNNINEKNFNCIGYPKNDKVLSLDFNGNFMYSSNFEDFFKDKKKK